jgi:DNA-binding FadR family transcriptional regulator
MSGHLQRGGRGMERLGLVSQLEADLERIIALDMLGKDGLLPSEQTLAEKYRVSRATAREALVRLSVRGLVVQHPGRKARAATLDGAMTLENLSLVLHGESSKYPERRRLLEGYFSLKREVTVELLAAACERANKEDLDRLEQACFALADVVRWRHQRHEWMEREFEMLREAAFAAGRPGHYLLIQSLERAARGVAWKVLPHVEAQALNRWAEFAFFALTRRDVQALRTELPPLMRASDERVLTGMASTRKAEGTLASHHPATQAPEVSNSTLEPTQSAPEACRPAPAECYPDDPSFEVETSMSESTGAPVPEELCVSESSAERGPLGTAPTEVGLPVNDAVIAVRPSTPARAETRPCLDKSSHGVGSSPPVPTETGRCLGRSGSEVTPLVPTAVERRQHSSGSAVGPSEPESAEAQGPVTLSATWSGCQTRSGQAQPERAPPDPASGPEPGTVTT